MTEQIEKKQAMGEIITLILIMVTLVLTVNFFIQKTEAPIDPCPKCGQTNEPMQPTDYVSALGRLVPGMECPKCKFIWAKEE